MSRIPTVATCQWREDEDGNWNTDCDEIHVLIDGTPENNNYRFCCYCGRVIEQVEYVEESL